MYSSVKCTRRSLSFKGINLRTLRVKINAVVGDQTRVYICNYIQYVVDARSILAVKVPFYCTASTVPELGSL